MSFKQRGETCVNVMLNRKEGVQEGKGKGKKRRGKAKATQQ